MTVVIFGLANIDAYFQARRKAEILHAKNPKLYPHFDSGERTFESLKPLSTQFDVECGNSGDGWEMGRELRDHPSVQVQYSDALTKVDFSHLEMIHPVDAWHPSIQGHKVLAEAAFRGLAPSLDFLGITSRPARCPQTGNHESIIR